MRTEDTSNRITRLLSHLRTEIADRSGLNLNDLAVHAEKVYGQILNAAFGWNLTSANAASYNQPGFDLVDVKQKILVQVSKRSDRAKIADALKKVPERYAGWTFKYMSICDMVAKPRKISSHLTSTLVYFDFAEDVIDPRRLHRQVSGLAVEASEDILSYLEKELPPVFRPQRPSNLAEIVLQLSRLEWPPRVEKSDMPPRSRVTIRYDIDRKIELNNLIAGGRLIKNQGVMYGRAQDVYDQLNKQGTRKGRSVQHKLQKLYWSLEPHFDPDELLVEMLQRVQGLVEECGELTGVPIEELELGVEILVVHSFMDCMIFKRLEESAYATP